MPHALFIYDPRDMGRASDRPDTDAAAYLGIAPSTLYKNYFARLEVVRLGKRSLITMASLDRLVDESRSQQPTVEPASLRHGRRARSESPAAAEP